MMRLLMASAALLLACCCGGANAVFPSSMPGPFTCDVTKVNDTVCYDIKCTDAIKDQIKVELDAAFSYMYIAALFDDDKQAWPGLAKFLYESASEERHHAILMLEYLNKRGVPYVNPSYEFKAANKTNLDNIIKHTNHGNALKLALEMEISVTMNIHGIIVACGKDFHGADYFTSVILEEQYDGMRKLQRAIKDLENLKAGDASVALADFLFDKKILENGL